MSVWRTIHNFYSMYLYFSTHTPVEYHIRIQLYLCMASHYTTPSHPSPTEEKFYLHHCAAFKNEDIIIVAYILG